ncbi:hypothetical protein [Herbaspirillum robiniae]|uniref:hypothetical protein n=1 Tax=Herbaspirillum robiniae TaxID=2014887 RepID=UPI0011E4D09E|nr:hypothetical protein [Herbaspirillum robiniae]
MNNFFAFDSDIAAPGSPRRDFRFLFKSPGTLRDGDLADAIEASATAALAPDGIAIVCIETEVAMVARALRNKSELKVAAGRLKGRISLYVCFVQKSGQIVLNEKICNASKPDEEFLKSASSRIFNAGLGKLFSSHHVLVEAPSGFTFVKPSGDRSTRFLRAEDALTEVENVHFLSCALLAKINSRHGDVERPIEVIYIDTMAIASVAYALCDLYPLLYGHPRPRVISFHSHDGLENFRFPLKGTSLCLISASSSMRLEGKWREMSRCHPAEVVTLLTFDSATNFKDALFALKDEKAPNTSVSSHELRDIRIAGERFAPEDLRPKKILLRKEAHKSESANTFSKLFSADGFLSVQRKATANSKKVRPIYLSDSALPQLKEFKSFLLKAVMQRVPASLSAIVYQDDNASKAMAEECALLLKPMLKNGAKLKLISHQNLQQQKNFIDRDGGLLIVAAIVGRGSKLLSIGRDLRPIHIGAKTYLVGAQIAETQSQLSSLVGNLRYSAEESLIHVDVFASVAIGESLALSYAREQAALLKLNLEEIQSPIAGRSNEVAGTTDGLLNNALMPWGSSLKKELALRPDFAYWDFKYKKNGNYTPAVLLTTAAILQQARESKKIAHANRLGTDAFQQVVLDPENFARYNDGVIQAALLRAALPGELDYSSESEASKYMADFLVKVFIQHTQAQGEAALEFALALHTNSVKLTEEHHKELIQQVKAPLTGNTATKKVLRILLGIDPPPVSSALPSWL